MLYALGICTGGQSISGNNMQQSIDKKSPSCFLIRGPRIGTFWYFIFPIFPPCICDDISAAVEELGWPATKLRLNGFTCLSVTVILIVAVIVIGIVIVIVVVLSPSSWVTSSSSVEEEKSYLYQANIVSKWSLQFWLLQDLWWIGALLISDI